MSIRRFVQFATPSPSVNRGKVWLLSTLLWGLLTGVTLAQEVFDEAESDWLSPTTFSSQRPDEAFDPEDPPDDLLEPVPNLEESVSGRRKTRPRTGRPGGGPPGYSAVWYPSQAVSGQGNDLGVVRQSLSLGAPVWKEEGRTLVFSVGARHSLYSGDIVLPETGRAFPEELWNINFGLNYMHRFDNGWRGMLMTNLGSSGDEPFQGTDELNGMLLGTITRPAGNERDEWTLGVMYTAGGNLNFPIPVVSYRWIPSDQFQMNIGVPFSMNWTPDEQWSVDVNWMPLTNVNARVRFAASEDVGFFAAYENLTDAYYLSGRTESRDRFFVFEQRLITGMEWSLSEYLTACLNGGYAFGREFGEGRNQGDRLHDRLKLDAGPFLGAQLQLNF